MRKPAPTDHPIHELLRERYSPRAFDPAAELDSATLGSLFEAARWAPSSMNEQPWRFVVVRRETRPGFAALVAALSENNRRWAKDAGALVVAGASLVVERSGKPNRHALHDLGLASAQLVLEATARGLITHPMGGFDADQVRALAAMPEGFEAVTVWAIGHPGDPEALPEDLRARERAARVRRPQASFVFEDTWDRPLDYSM